MAMIRSCRYGSGLTTLTATHPKVPPTRKVIPILTGMNHLIYIKNNFKKKINDVRIGVYIAMLCYHIYIYS